MHDEWKISLENLKWFIGVAYPSSKKEHIKVNLMPTTKSDYVPTQKQIINEPPKILHLNSKLIQGHFNLYCPNCGTKFSERMNSVIITKKMTFCELCGQQFIVPNEIFA